MNTRKQVLIMSALLALMLVLTGVYAAWYPSRAIDAADYFDERTSERGAIIFARNCRLCHGDVGEGGSLGGRLPAAPALHRSDLQGFVDSKEKLAAAPKDMATRAASEFALEALVPALPEMLGGSADLTGSNLTNWEGCHPVRHGNPGNYISYGVREFGMAAIMNGMALHGGLIPYGGTFLTFSDYSRNALRMAALMKIRSLFVFTHDSIGLGEDGPTHQPVEHLASLRIIPRMEVWRPCDTAETWVAWGAAIARRHAPTVLALTRQALPQQARDVSQLDAIRRGGYVLVDCAGRPECILIATGSEVGIAVDAARELAVRGRKVRVVSMPATSVFDAQQESWRAAVLPPDVPRRVAIEAGVADGWWRYVGPRGRVIGMKTFGASGTGKDLFRHFGFTTAAVIEAVESLLNTGEI